MKRETLANKWNQLTKKEEELARRLRVAGERSQKRTELLFVLRDVMLQKLVVENKMDR